MNRALQPVILIIALLALSCSTTGCGDDGPSQPTVDIPWGPSKDYYVERANQVCRKSWAGARESFQSRYHGAQKGEPFDEASQNIFLPTLQIAFDDISFLGAPVPEKDQVKELLTAMQLAVFAGQGRSVEDPEEFAAIFADFNRQAGRYELNDCLVLVSSFRPR